MERESVIGSGGLQGRLRPARVLAEIQQNASVTGWMAGVADLTSVADKVKVGGGISRGREQAGQVFVGRFGAHRRRAQPKPAAHPVDVRVDGEGGLA